MEDPAVPQGRAVVAALECLLHCSHAAKEAAISVGLHTSLVESCTACHQLLTLTKRAPTSSAAGFSFTPAAASSRAGTPRGNASECADCSSPRSKLPATGSAGAALVQLLQALHLLSALARRGGPAVSQAMVACDVLGAVQRLWVLALAEDCALQACLDLLTSLATSGSMAAMLCQAGARPPLLLNLAVAEHSRGCVLLLRSFQAEGLTELLTTVLTKCGDCPKLEQTRMAALQLLRCIAESSTGKTHMATGGSGFTVLLGCLEHEVSGNGRHATLAESILSSITSTSKIGQGHQINLKAHAIP
ncbi:hypothetical protein WJX73_004604 [Symbiochloris irregularis]|uniref:Uncharacterized protein n=1 Tax=Symbiochloris irregularis TaxID=706552 RepID=A0AAW1P066_9CHLO